MSSVGVVAGSLSSTGAASRLVAAAFFRAVDDVDVRRRSVTRGAAVDVGAGFSPPVEGVVVVERVEGVVVVERVEGVVVVVDGVEGAGVVTRAVGVVPVRTPRRDSRCADSRSRKSRLSRAG